jgi:hypothetical protein
VSRAPTLPAASRHGGSARRAPAERSRSSDARDKARNSREGAVQAIRAAWSHILFPVKTEGTKAGRAFDLDHLSLTARDRSSVPVAVYDKARGDGISRPMKAPTASHYRNRWSQEKVPCLQLPAECRRQVARAVARANCPTGGH